MTYINLKIRDKEQHFTNSHKKLTWCRIENKHNVVGHAERINIKISTLSCTLIINFHIFKKNSLWNHCHTEHIDSLCSYINLTFSTVIIPVAALILRNVIIPVAVFTFWTIIILVATITFCTVIRMHDWLLQCLFASILITLVYNLVKTEISWQNTEIETHFNDYLSMTVNLILCDVMSTAINSYCPGQCYIINLCDSFT